MKQVSLELFNASPERTAAVCCKRMKEAKVEEKDPKCTFQPKTNKAARRRGRNRLFVVENKLITTGQSQESSDL